MRYQFLVTIFVALGLFIAVAAIAKAEDAQQQCLSAADLKQYYGVRVKDFHLEIFVPKRIPASLSGDTLEVSSWEHASIRVNACEYMDPLCKSKDKRQLLYDLFIYTRKYPEDIDISGKLICDFLRSPTKETRQALHKALPKAPFARPDNIQETLAYMYAFRGNSKACQDAIKSYVGPYGPAWTGRWYVNMSGCRIMTYERTVQEEEKDLQLWLEGRCSDIINAEMKAACNDPNAPRPVTPFD